MGEDAEDIVPLMRPFLQIEQKYAPKDDWTGLTDPKQRRKLQNRLNQRLYRTRHGLDIPKPRKKRATRIGASGTDKQELHASDASNSNSTDSSRSPPGIPCIQGSEADDMSTTLVRQYATMCTLSPMDKQLLIMDFNNRVHQSSRAGSPRLDMLLTLVHFNVFRALVSNTFSMGFDMSWLTADAISPFHLSQQAWSSTSCPSQLLPTVLQQTVEHHPWIDLFPFPAMRDNLLAADGQYDEDQLCIDLVEFCHIPYEQAGLIVWGEPGDPSGWEVSEAFLSKWSWVLRGCHELLESTNRWRDKRGEEALIWELE